MNASALLTSQGWRGEGHSLHKTDDSVGLAKPLLLNRKDNTKGIGATQHFTSDQWWMNAFDEQLQGLDTTKKGKVVQTVKTGRLNALERGSLAKYSLYATFVRGGLLEGSIQEEKQDGRINEDGDESTSSESDSDSDEKTQAKAKGTLAAMAIKETKEERRARKEAKRNRREARAQRKLARKSKKSKSKSDSSDDVDTDKALLKLARKWKKTKSKSDSSDDADEEKRRRRARKEEKRRRRKENEGN
ncbi:hypothetical protein NQ176_g6203 [Zarea fungicola]|uniref:Uncharacterized protein n=1 Tax=Zarea fungicola TaxID=93591 RepID=A0ACC1N5H5_9HYPO|nr:hypothetical protein NQ176_g6203 [Lecanicillium fungicola]